MSNYTADAIRILTQPECVRQFQFVRVQAYARQYPTVAIEFIDRLLTACALAGFDEERAVRRYLAKDRSVDVSTELQDVHRELRNARYNPPRTL